MNQSKALYAALVLAFTITACDRSPQTPRTDTMPETSIPPPGPTQMPPPTETAPSMPPPPNESAPTNSGSQQSQ
jgi:hypothetical protein